MVSRNNAAMRYRALSPSCVRTPGCTYKRLNRSPGILLTPSIPSQRASGHERRVLLQNQVNLIGKCASGYELIQRFPSRTKWASSLDKVGQDIALTLVVDSLAVGDPCARNRARTGDPTRHSADCLAELAPQ